MYFDEKTLDDLLFQVLTQLLKQENELIQATRGEFAEIFGAMLVLRNPRARLSRSESKGKIFSALGELFWYLSKRNDLDFIDYYVPKWYREKESDDGVSVRSGYGERLFCHQGQDQLQNVIGLLKDEVRKTTRRAVVQLFDASDLSKDFKSIPCTCTLQFLIRDEKLNLLVNMRSNDAYRGLPHDVFAFTMLQELVARSVGVELGEYRHCAGSLHLYKDDFGNAKKYLSEGWQSHKEMPPMPASEPWAAILKVQQVEEQVRSLKDVDIAFSGLDHYWADLCRLLVAYQKYKRAQKSKADISSELAELKDQMCCQNFNLFIDSKLDSLERKD